MQFPGKYFVKDHTVMFRSSKVQCSNVHRKIRIRCIHHSLNKVCDLAVDPPWYSPAYWIIKSGFQSWLTLTLAAWHWLDNGVVGVVTEYKLFTNIPAALVHQINHIWCVLSIHHLHHALETDYHSWHLSHCNTITFI